MSKEWMTLNRWLPNPVFWRSIVLGGFILALLFFAFSSIRKQPAVINSTAPQFSCVDLIENGGFENGLFAWSQIGSSPIREYNPTTIVSPVFSGTSAIRIGAMSNPSEPITNGIRQNIFLPPSSVAISLRFYYIPKYRAAPDDDLQFVDLYDLVTGQKLARVFSELADNKDWLFRFIDLTSFRGNHIALEFGVQNDGAGGGTALLLDNVSLLACFNNNEISPAANALSNTGQSLDDLIIPTPTPTPTRTPLPTPYVLQISPSFLDSSETAIATSFDQLWFPSISIADFVLPKDNSSVGYLILMNTSGTMDLSGWTLSDSLSNIYHFSSFIFPEKSALRIQIGTVESQENRLSWELEDPDALLQNNVTIMLKNPAGNIVDRITRPLGMPSTP